MAPSQKTATKPTSSTSSIFVQRAVSTFTLGPLALLLIYLGGWLYFVPFTLIIIVATFEYSRLLGRLGLQLPVAILLPAVLLQLVAAEWPELDLFAPTLALSLIVVALYALWRYERRAASMVTAEWAGLVAGVLLLGWMSGHFFLLRGLPEMAASWTILVMVSTWVADSAAYVFGTRFGRHKLAPRLSPGKTIEGYIGGVIVGTGVTVGLAVLLNLPWALALLLGLLISIVSTGGDLAISLIKREAGVKDSGQLLPGHGGALDRIDSLLWSVTIAYYVILLFT